MTTLSSLTTLVSQIKALMTQARAAVTQEVNAYNLKTYWEIGRIIVEYEQKGNVKAQYGIQLLKDLSKRLTQELGTGFSRSSPQNMRNFYLAYPICQTVSGKLSWSHYCELLIISDKDKRAFYEQECQNASWSVRELKRQIETSLFERLLLSEGNTNKAAILLLTTDHTDDTDKSDKSKNFYRKVEKSNTFLRILAMFSSSSSTFSTLRWTIPHDFASVRSVWSVVSPKVFLKVKLLQIKRLSLHFHGKALR